MDAKDLNCEFNSIIISIALPYRKSNRGPDTVLDYTIIKFSSTVITPHKNMFQQKRWSDTQKNLLKFTFCRVIK